jgi:hypothetical protein
MLAHLIFFVGIMHQRYIFDLGVFCEFDFLVRFSEISNSKESFTEVQEFNWLTAETYLRPRHDLGHEEN